MISFIKGTVAAYGVDYAVIENHGIGWHIFYPHTEDIRLNQEISVFTYMHLTENDISLFGFASQEEKDLFMKLIGVKGIGPKTAMNMLMTSGYDALVANIAEGNVAALKKIPGIGAKAASQIVLDMQGKLVTYETTPKTKSQTVQYPPEIADALEGLKNLGYRPNELGPAAHQMMEQPGLTTAEYLRIGLRFLSK